MRKEMPDIDVRLRMSYPVNNKVERPGVTLVLEDAASGLLIADLELSDAQLVDLLATRGVQVVGKRTPHLDCIGKEQHNARVLVTPRGYYGPADEEAVERIMKWTERSLVRLGARHTRRDRNQAGLSVVAWWYGTEPDREAVELVEKMARKTLAEALEGKGSK